MFFQERTGAEQAAVRRDDRPGRRAAQHPGCPRQEEGGRGRGKLGQKRGRDRCPMSFIGLLLELLINISQDYRKDLSYVGRELLYGAIRKVSYRVSDSSCHPPKKT